MGWGAMKHRGIVATPHKNESKTQMTHRNSENTHIQHKFTHKTDDLFDAPINGTPNTGRAVSAFIRIIMTMTEKLQCIGIG